MTRTYVPAAIALTILSACGGGSTATRDTGIIAEPPRITFLTSAIGITQDRLDNTLTYSRNQDTALGGSADFIGGFASDLTVNGEDGQQLVGNIDMSMNFETDEITGVMRNMGIADSNGVATEGVQGIVNLTGTVGPVAASAKPTDLPGSSGANTGVAENILQVEGDGLLFGNFGEQTQGAIPVDVDLIGHARSPSGDDREWFSGVVDGDGQGVHDIDFAGRFYLFEDTR